MYEFVRIILLSNEIKGGLLSKKTWYQCQKITSEDFVKWDVFIDISYLSIVTKHCEILLTSVSEYFL